MEGIFVVLPLLLLQHAVFPITAQTVTLSTEGIFVENLNGLFLCDFTEAWDPTTFRDWIGPNSISVITKGVSTNTTKYAESTDNTVATKQFSMTIKNYDSSNEGDYQCQYGFFTSNTITLSTSNTEAHPSSSNLENLNIPKAGEEISLNFSVSGIRPAATASYNITSGQSTQTDNANVTSTNDANGRTKTSSVQINVPGSRIAGDIFTLTLVVGTYTQTEQWTIQGTPTTPTPSPCRCDWDWLPCDWECYYFYIIIAAVVVVVVFLLVVGVCCCCRQGYCCDDDTEACVCCVRKKKMCKDSVNLNENGNGQKNVLRSSENGRQVNPSESGKEDTSESHCHNNPAYYASEGTDM